MSTPGPGVRALDDRAARLRAMRTGPGTAGAWQAQVSGAQLVPGVLNARQRLGSPGGPGGREIQTVAVQTSDGRLAYDMSRAALRRTRHLLPRLVLLSVDRWAPPAAATSGNFSAAMLQTVAPVAETPSNRIHVADQRSRLSADWPAVVDKVFAKFPQMPQIPKPLPNILQDALDKIINQLKSSTSGPRIFDEFKREFAATVHGRRDASWALMRARGAACELIYIDGAAFAPGYGTPATPVDLVPTIRDRLQAVPSLRVILRLSKELDYGRGYEVVAARKYEQRLDAVATLQDAAPSPVAVFHEHVQALADFWAEVFGGPTRYSSARLGHSGMLELHAVRGAADTTPALEAKRRDERLLVEARLSGTSNTLSSVWSVVNICQESKCCGCFQKPGVQPFAGGGVGVRSNHP